jgi:hypothetical protein
MNQFIVDILGGGSSERRTRSAKDKEVSRWTRLKCSLDAASTTASMESVVIREGASFELRSGRGVADAESKEGMDGPVQRVSLEEVVVVFAGAGDFHFGDDELPAEAGPVRGRGRGVLGEHRRVETPGDVLETVQRAERSVRAAARQRSSDPLEQL